MKATETLLYKALAPKIRRQDRKEFARMLELALKSADRSDSYYKYDASTEIIDAFDWEKSPQGYDYWSALDDLLYYYDFKETAP